ncbi:hypothetical protein [Microbacterium binotii]|uniref:hypothetical protein n=1 Tax=Microbacterium binotii TaxID=462710 RepID=UPI001F3096F5|nr:hypothetical protein [Microbacterium binotii]UIN31561.1 hypothetical protein LXM64_05000 [Microbacterium binotii]
MRDVKITGSVFMIGLALVLTGCGGTPDSPPPTRAAAVSTGTPTPTPSVTLTPSPQAESVQIPGDCGAVGSAATRAATVDQMTEYGDAAQFTRPAPPGANLALGCNWIVGDATGYLLLISRADADAAQSYAESTLPAEGYSCQVGDAPAFICTQTLAGTTYPVDTVETIYVRDGVWIYQSATNTDGDALLTDLVAAVWGS